MGDRTSDPCYGVPRVRPISALQVVLDEICDAGEGWAIANEVAELVPEEKNVVYRFPAILRVGRVRSH
jgi:hypothetical protein